MFRGLNRYQIGLPEPGMGYLYITLDRVEGMSAADALTKLESMGYEPQLRFYDNGETLSVCALLRVCPVTANPEDDLFMDEWERLWETFPGEAAVSYTKCRPKVPMAA